LWEKKKKTIKTACLGENAPSSLVGHKGVTYIHEMGVWYRGTKDPLKGKTILLTPKVRGNMNGVWVGEGVSGVTIPRPRHRGRKQRARSLS